MSNTETVMTPSDHYMARVLTAALIQCDNKDQAAQLVAQQVALYPRIDQTIAQAGELLENDQTQQAISLLDEMIDRVGRFTRPYPTAAVQDVFAYPLTRLYFERAVMRFGAASSSTDLEVVLADLNRAVGYPTATFEAIDPELLTTMREFRTTIQAVLKGQQKFEAREGGQTGGSSKSGKCFIATAAYGSAFAPEVVTLRRFRETTLRPHAAGRWFIRLYERCSPPLAAAIAERPAAQRWVRRLLLRPLIALVGPASDKDRC